MFVRRPDGARARLVARTEIVRGIRAIQENRTQIVALAIGAFFLGVSVLGTAVFGLYPAVLIDTPQQQIFGLTQ